VLPGAKESKPYRSDVRAFQGFDIVSAQGGTPA
jgi:hypothetical protein